MALDSGREILDSWKQIAQYLHREVRTCYRWSRELDLPVHRIDENSPKSKVFAYKAEIDGWLQERARSQVLAKNGSPRKRRWIYGSLSFLALLSVVAVATWPPFAPSGKVVSVAVAPLAGFEASGSNGYLSEELSRIIADGLPVPNKLRVIPAFRIRRSVEAIEGGKEAENGWKADYVLRGEIKGKDPAILVSVELRRTGSGSVIWKSSFLAPADEIWTIPPSICSEVRKALKISAGSDALEGNYSDDRLALDSYLKGDFVLGRLDTGSDDPWQFYHQGEYYAGRFTPAANELAIKLFSQAIKTDPGFALAHVGLASCYANYVNFNWQRDISWLDKAEDILAKAQALTPDLPEYFSTLMEVRILRDAAFDENVWASVGDLAARGAKVSGNHPALNSIIGYYYFRLFGRDGDRADFRRALEYKERSFWLNPLDVRNIVYANLLMLNKEFDKALEVCDILDKVDETHMSRFLRGEILYYRGDWDGSRSVFEPLTDVSLEYRIGALYYLAMISAGKADAAGTERTLNEIRNISPDDFVYFEKDLKVASLWAGLGKKDFAYRTLSGFLALPKYQKNIHIYEKYADLDRNFLAMKEDDDFKSLFDIKGETDGQK